MYIIFSCNLKYANKLLKHMSHDFIHTCPPWESLSSQKESCQPCVPLTIYERMFELVINYLKAINYNGHIALSCDDSKLFSSLQLYDDSNKDKHFLVGAVGGPIVVPNPDDIKTVMSDPAVVKATKVSFNV